MSEGGDFPAFYEREFAMVFRAVLPSCGDRQAAEDATQEAFARALVRWRRLRGESWAAGWVTTTALNVARRAMRRRAIPSADRPAAERDHEAHLDVRAAIRRLPARQQEAVTLHYLLDLSVADAALAMHVDEGTVKTHLARARKTLASTLEATNEGTDRGGGSPGDHDVAATRRINAGGTDDA